LLTNNHICKFNTILSTIKKQLNDSHSSSGCKLYFQLIQAFTNYCTEEPDYAAFLQFKTACHDAMEAVKAHLCDLDEWQQIYKSLSAIITFIGGPATYSYKKANPGVLFFNRTEEPVDQLLKKVEQNNPTKFIISV